MSGSWWVFFDLICIRGVYLGGKLTGVCMLLKSVELAVEQGLNLSFYLEMAKMKSLGVSSFLFLVDLGYPEVHLVLLERDDVPGFVLYRMALRANDDVCLAMAKSTKVKAVLHLLANHENSAVVEEVKGNTFVSAVTLEKFN